MKWLIDLMSPKLSFYEQNLIKKISNLLTVIGKYLVTGKDEFLTSSF